MTHGDDKTNPAASTADCVAKAGAVSARPGPRKLSRPPSTGFPVAWSVGMFSEKMRASVDTRNIWDLRGPRHLWSLLPEFRSFRIEE